MTGLGRGCSGLLGRAGTGAYAYVCSGWIIRSSHAISGQQIGSPDGYHPNTTWIASATSAVYAAAPAPPLASCKILLQSWCEACAAPTSVPLAHAPFASPSLKSVRFKCTPSAERAVAAASRTVGRRGTAHGKSGQRTDRRARAVLAHATSRSLPAGVRTSVARITRQLHDTLHWNWA